MTRQEILGEITACKSLLSDSDHSILKTLENLLSCTSATQIITYFKELTTEVVDLKEKRQQWRDRINELEAQLDTLPTDGDDGVEPGI